jgi:GTP-binding protein
MSAFQQTVFFQSVGRPGDLPPTAGPEVAFAGRSNAGKSSAINALTGRTRLAFVSKTPGRTQVINFFRIGPGFLVDLPGYGYAKVPDAVRDTWQDLLESYLTGRESLCALVLIMDVRHPLTELDRQLMNWFAPTGKPIHILLTKADKLTRQQALTTLAQVRAELSGWGAQVSLQLFSSLKRQGVDEAAQRLANWLGIETGDTKEKPPVKGEKNRGPNALM